MTKKSIHIYKFYCKIKQYFDLSNIKYDFDQHVYDDDTAGI